MLSEYIPLKEPHDRGEGLMFSSASKGQLDIFGKRVDIKRRTFLFLKEPDVLYKIRIKNESIREIEREKG